MWCSRRACLERSTASSCPAGMWRQRYIRLFRRHGQGCFGPLGDVSGRRAAAPNAAPNATVDAVDDVLGAVEAGAAAGTVPEREIDLPRAAPAALRDLAAFGFPIAVAATDVHPVLLRWRSQYGATDNYCQSPRHREND